MSQAANSENVGVLYGVGLGPGDPELVTLKAYRLLSGAAVIAYPAPLDAEGTPKPSLARRIAEDFLDTEVEEIPIPLPMRSDDLGPADAAYDEAAEAIAERLSAGEDVAVLCEGDPMFYGSFMYLAERLSSRFEVETIPGVTSISAAAAALGHPLCARDEGFAVIPATLPDEEIEARLAGCEAAAILKIGRHLPRLKALLRRLGLEDRASYAERIGQEGEHVAPLSAAPEAAPYFSLLLIRKNEALR